MGEIVFKSGMGSDLYAAANRFTGKIPGGLAVSTVIASAIFGAMCGVSIAGAATIGSAAIPEMIERGYSKRLASGSVAAGYTELKLDKKILANKQALAAVGQPLLMHRYKKKFEKHNVITSQVLVTTSNFNTSEQVKIAENAINTLLNHDILPIVQLGTPFVI